MAGARATESPDLAASRLAALDLLRGLILVLMALDHARAFLHRTPRDGEYWGGFFPEYSSALPFVIRGITHLCAPGFFFLMGASVALFAQNRLQRGWTDGQITRHFAVRGAALMVFQQILVNPAWLMSGGTTGSPGQGDSTWIYLGVLWGLGGTMVLAALLRRLSSPMLAVLALALTVCFAVLTPGESMAQSAFSPMQIALVIPAKSGIFMSKYPPLPWLSVVLWGLLFGRYLVRDKGGIRHALPLGLLLLCGFVLVRGVGNIGNLHAAESQTWISWLNVTKYPPSVAFQLLTLGVDLTLLGLFARLPALPERNPLTVFGGTALFFYVSHLYLYGLLGTVFAGTGLSLVQMLPFWVLGLVILYPACRWYGPFKRSRGPNSLWRFL